jgi:hypothetical protein
VNGILLRRQDQAPPRESGSAVTQRTGGEAPGIGPVREGVMKGKAGKTKATKAKGKKSGVRDLKPNRADGAKGGFVPNTNRFDPYKNFKF